MGKMPRIAKNPHPLAVVRKIISEKFPLNQEELSNLVNCSRNYIQRIETNRSALAPSIAQQIDSVLGTSFFDHIESGEAIETYPINEAAIIGKFIECQFADIEGFTFRGLRKQLYYDKFLDSSDDNASKGAKIFQLQRIVNKVVSGFGNQLIEAVNQMPISEENKPRMAAEILDSISSGHPYAQASQFVWGQAQHEGIELETAWEHRKWIEQMNERYGLGVNLKSFYSGAGNDLFNNKRFLGRIAETEGEVIKQSDKGYISPVDKIQQAKAKRKAK